MTSNSLQVTSVHKANWKENLVAYQKSLGALFEARLSQAAITVLKIFIKTLIDCINCDFAGGK